MEAMSLEEFAEYIRRILKSGDIDKAIKEIELLNLSEDEQNKLFFILRTNGYDSKTGNYIFVESDNKAFLDLVSSVQSKVSKG